jgi:hypothetical protein
MLHVELDAILRRRSLASTVGRGLMMLAADCGSKGDFGWQHNAHRKFTPIHPSMNQADTVGELYLIHCIFT